MVSVSVCGFAEGRVSCLCEFPITLNDQGWVDAGTEDGVPLRTSEALHFLQQW
jgi:hypothetical protein